MLALNSEETLVKINDKGKLEYGPHKSRIDFLRCGVYRESLLSLPGDMEETTRVKPRFSDYIGRDLTSDPTGTFLADKLIYLAERAAANCHTVIQVYSIGLLALLGEASDKIEDVKVRLMQFKL
ncbi:unnamed protein product [Sphenostylis stenocarpa]|uniref:Uncharacterized protein n=1 Tax=Sphenostylis stenocarpa TaxID=92480 RepID=A0AA86VMN7_9FABA|nr:unnamed protein product [Sphenostylis stenocarpa]